MIEAVLLAFLGGVILNLMPCVLPVISLKVMSLVKLSGESRASVLKNSLLFFMGVMTSFWVLASALLILRTYGESVGWGFQLQSPLFVGGLIASMFLFALSLLGVFEINVSGGDSSNSGSFMSGVMATVLATPCTGPFLGTAIGLALSLSNVQAMLVFTAIGAGMASPYLLIGIFPSLLKVLPKPGRWMIVFKEATGFIILATVMWLAWVFAALTGPQGLLLLMSALFPLALAAWLFGKFGGPANKKLLRRSILVVSTALLAVSGYQVLEASKQIHKEAPTTVDFSLAGLAEHRASGKAIFIDFTAKWCLICQTNKAVLHSDAVKKLFADKGILFMEADWTRANPEITKALDDLGRAGVPVYVYYPPGENSEPIILPQLLTEEIIKDVLEGNTTLRK